jgi:8-oxo-dGTP pyrophosphatase MutT (NUDIX family)
MEGKKHIVAVNAFIKNKSGDKFLVLKRHDNEIAYPGKWAFPGGKLEKGSDILETLKREVLEEAGLEIEDSKRFINDFTFIRPDGHNVVGLLFEVMAKSDNVKISEDFTDFKWATPEEFFKLDFIERMENDVKLALNL